MFVVIKNEFKNIISMSISITVAIRFIEVKNSFLLNELFYVFAENAWRKSDTSFKVG